MRKYTLSETCKHYKLRNNNQKNTFRATNDFQEVLHATLGAPYQTAVSRENLRGYTLHFEEYSTDQIIELPAQHATILDSSSRFPQRYPPAPTDIKLYPRADV